MSNINVVPKIPIQTPGQQELNLPVIANPYDAVWWISQTVTDVPENIMGWLVAQGFQVTGIRQDNTTNPPTNYFSVRKDGLQPQLLLRSLCENYFVQANNAKIANELRYNDVVRNWTQMIDTSHDQFDAQIDEQNYQSGMYLADLDLYMTAIETLINENRSQVIVDAENAKVELGKMLSRIEDLETNAINNSNLIGTLLATQNNNFLTYVTNYNTKLLELDQNFAAYLADMLSQIAALGTVLDTHVSDFNQQLTVLSNNYAAHLSDINTQMTAISANVTAYVAEVEAILALIETDFQEVALDLELEKGKSETLVSNYDGSYDSILERLSRDYEEHATIARGFLTNLGQTDTARINEEFNSSLSKQIQMLISSGLSTSTIPVDIAARNARDRDEQIQLLNDRLNREKLDNQHRLYEQQVNVRARTLDGIDRVHSVRQEILRYQATLISNVYSLRTEARNRILAGKQAVFSARDANMKYGIEVSSNMYAKLQEVRQRFLDSADRIYQLRDIFAKWKAEDTARRYQQIQQIEAQILDSIQKQYLESQDVIKVEMAERDTLLGQIQNALTALMSGRERYAVLLMQNANSLAEHKHRAIVEMMNTSVARLQGWKSVAEDEQKLMAYQLDERNKLLVGLYSFVERREDVGPQWAEMTKMLAGLGDSSGGWLQP